ncbi:MAG: sigma-54 dependent transcriptional regulator [bacterium]
MEPGRILIVDDERAVCSGCRLVLAEKGYAVDLCMTGREGIDAIRHGGYALALLDLKLPDLDGMDILRSAFRERPELPVIIMTGYSTVQTAVEAMKLKACDYLVKPFSDDDLLFAVERALQKGRLVEANRTLREGYRDRYGFEKIVGRTPEMSGIYEQVEKVGPTDSTVVLYGESGTGKELFARAVHAHSNRRSRQFVAVDCSTLSPSLLESELFGHVKGAFTGATDDKAGIFEVASGGTLFLDDVANLSLEVQGKLLRVLESQEYKAVGASVFRKTDVRIIAATNKDLKAMVEAGSFREDLFYRLNVFPIFLPPLRERREDIPELAYHFLRLFCRQTGKRIDGFSDDALEVLARHDWPGNVRELKNVVERLVILADGGVLSYVHLFDHMRLKRFLGSAAVPETFEELKAMKKRILRDFYGQIEKAFLLKALNAANGNVTRAAARVGIQRPNFHALLKRHKLASFGRLDP